MAVAHNPADGSRQWGGYSQGLEVASPGRFLFISGQIPEGADGEVPAGFDQQCPRVWENVLAVLRSAGMTVDDLVKVTTYLSDRRYAAANAEVRRRFLGRAEPALTVVITGIFEEAWLLEVEAVAFAAMPET
jgi:2-iminobutanoate/2-iminopropanoate deaminase